MMRRFVNAKNGEAAIPRNGVVIRREREGNQGNTGRGASLEEDKWIEGGIRAFSGREKSWDGKTSPWSAEGRRNIKERESELSGKEERLSSFIEPRSVVCT